MFGQDSDTHLSVLPANLRNWGLPARRGLRVDTTRVDTTQASATGRTFADGYGVAGSVRDVIGADVEVPGCPPRPEDIVTALRSVTGR